MTKRICIWSGPRNISTALMYSFAQRSDTVVVDEPFYGHYLSQYPAYEYHPGAEEVVAIMENDWRKVVDDILAPKETPVIFYKMMTHHIMEIDWDFMRHTVNVLLTRAPQDMLPSYAKNVEQPQLLDTGYADHIKLLDYLQSIGQTPPVLESQEVLKNPRRVLGELCDQMGIPFEEAMLSWEAGPRPEDGSWAKYWYHNVHKSTGFQPYKPKTEPFPEHLRPLLAECLPYYEQLAPLAIMAD
ncbi:MAG: sulfotransferase family protein [Chloroflexota bacterium]